MAKDWIPTRLEAEIATAVLQEYGENPQVCRTSWAVRFLNDLFPRVAGYYNDTEEALAEEGCDSRPFSHKQHHSFWNVVTRFGWRSLAQHRQIVDTVHGLQQSMKATYDGRWIEEEATQIRKQLDSAASEAFRQLVALRVSTEDGNAA